MATPNMGMVLPTDHASTDVWGATLNAALTNQVDLHNHTAGLGVLVPVAGLNLNADLNLSGTHAIAGALALDMTPTVASAVAAYSSALFTDNSNNLFFRNSGGTNIQITSGSSLNFSVTGGIGGDYTSVGALVTFTDASDLYTFQQQIGAGVRQYARVAMGDLDLFQYIANPAGGVPTTRVRQKSPAALAGSYDLTWLAALPASTVGMQVSNAGQISASNTFASALVAPDFKNNSDLILSVQNSLINAGSNASVSGGPGRLSINLNGGTGAGAQCCIPIPLRVGDQIRSWTVFLRKTTDATNTINACLHSYTPSTNVIVDHGSVGGKSNSANAPGFITLTDIGGDLPLTMVAGNEYYIHCGMFAGAGTTDSLYYAEINYQRP